MLSLSVSPITVLGTDTFGSSQVALPYLNQIGKNKSGNSSIKPNLVETVKSIGESIIDGLNFVIEPVKKLVTFKQLGEIAMVPFNVVSIVKNCIGFPKYTHEKRIDTGLNICNNLREIGESAATFVVALEDVHAIPVSPVAWATPFAIVMSVLSVASIVSNFRTCMKVRRFMKEINLAEASGKVDGKITQASYRAILNLIEKKQSEDEDFISDMFNISEEKFAELLVDKELKVINKQGSEDPKEVEEGQEILEKTIKSLKGRVKQNITSSILAIISSTINIIGTAVLLAFPVLPVGWAILGLATLLDGTRWIHHKVIEYQFAKAVELKRTKWEWITC